MSKLNRNISILKKAAIFRGSKTNVHKLGQISNDFTNITYQTLDTDSVTRPTEFYNLSKAVEIKLAPSMSTSTTWLHNKPFNTQVVIFSETNFLTQVTFLLVKDLGFRNIAARNKR